MIFGSATFASVRPVVAVVSGVKFTGALSTFGSVSFAGVRPANRVVPFPGNFWTFGAFPFSSTRMGTAAVVSGAGGGGSSIGNYSRSVKGAQLTARRHLYQRQQQQAEEEFVMLAIIQLELEEA